MLTNLPATKPSQISPLQPIIPNNTILLKHFHYAINQVLNGVNYQMTWVDCGDSYSGLRTQYLIGSFTTTPVGYPLMAELLQHDCGSQTGTTNISTTFTGGAALTGLGTNNAYWAIGEYWTLPAAGTIKLGLSGTAANGNEFAVYPITDSGAGTLSLDLMNTGYTASLSNVTFNCAGTLGAKKIGFFIMDLTFTGTNGDLFTLTYGGQTTGNITYSTTTGTTVTNIQTALAGLTVGTALTGLVTVSYVSGTTYQVIIQSNGGGTVPSRAQMAYTFVSGTGTTCALGTAACWIRITGSSGTCSLVPQSVLINRSTGGFLAIPFTFPGRQMSTVIGINQGIFNAVMGDIAPDFLTLDCYAGQVDSAATYNSWVTMWQTACPTSQMDGLHIGFAPSDVTSDAITQNRIAVCQPICEASGWVWFDSWTLCPGQAVLNSYPGWNGDGIHQGIGYNQYIVGYLKRLLNLSMIGYGPLTGKVSTDWISVNGGRPGNEVGSGNITFGNNINNTNAAGIFAEPTFGEDLIFQMFTANRFYEFRNNSGTAIARIASNNAVGGGGFFLSGFAVGSSGPTIASGSGAPSGTPPNGSIYLRTNYTGPLATLYVYVNGAWTGVI